MSSPNKPNFTLSPQVRAYFRRWVFCLARAFLIDDSTMRDKIRACHSPHDVKALADLLIKKGVVAQLGVCAGYHPTLRLKCITDRQNKKIIALKLSFELKGAKLAQPIELASFVASEIQAQLHLPGGVVGFGSPSGDSTYTKNGFGRCIKSQPVPLAKNLLKFYRQLLNSFADLPKCETTGGVWQNMLDEIATLQSGNLKGTLCPELVPNLAEFFAMVDKVFGTSTSPHDSLAAHYARICHEIEGNKAITAEQLYNKMALSDKWQRNFTLTNDGSQIKAIGARVALHDHNGHLTDVMVFRVMGSVCAGTCTLIRSKGFTASSLVRKENAVHPQKLRLLCQNPENMQKMQTVLRAFIARVGGDKVTRQHCQSVLLFLSTLPEAHAGSQLDSLQEMNDTKAC